jgi:hypothetical protein
MLSHQDGHHSAVALLLKAALIQVSDYRLLGVSCCMTYSMSNSFIKKEVIQIKFNSGGHLGGRA